MQRDSRAFLWDALTAAENARSFASGKNRQDLASDLLLASAVERQLQNMGEALTQMNRLDPSLAARIPELPQIIGFRNVLVHQYMSVDDEVIWTAIETRLPRLCDVHRGLLDELDSREA